ncbi:MAG TPA: DUF2267 domain-containing protein [Baekduia sp.]|jgi:uncharacterized protein (DUF2267 family)|nr:DUF2267 domain-containing protein [Baekduia sp.]
MSAADHERFIVTVQQMARLSRDEAQRATEATLATLSERLSSGAVRDLAEQLPEELRPLLASDTDATGITAAEFVELVADREGVDDLAAAELHVHAVFDALQRFVDERELNQMESELSKDYVTLTAPMEKPRRPEVPGQPEPLPVEEFLRRVADRAATDVATARRVTDAVLETLGERIAHGEVADLAAELAPEFREPLEQGDVESHGRAQRMPLDEFLRRVAEREGISRELAPDHARAVFRTLREALPEREVSDLLAQLPSDYEPMLAA